MRKGIKSVWNVVAVMIIGAMLATILPASLAKATSLEDSSLSPQSADPAIAKAIDSVSEAEILIHILNLQDDERLPGLDAERSRYSFASGALIEVDYIYEEFQEYELSVRYDEFKDSRGHLLKNIVAEKIGRLDPSRIYIVAAHYDSTASRTPDWAPQTKPAPGADDNASGVAAMLEVARVLSPYEFNYTLRFIAFSGEEQGLVGSKHYAETAREEGENIVGVINLDMIGYREEGEEDKLYVIGNNASSWLVNKLIEDSAIYGVKISLLKILDDRWRYSDHASFWDQEYVAVCLFEGFNQDSEPASLAVNPYHHTVNDTWKALRLSQIAKASKLTIAAIAELAGLSSSEGGINLQYLGHSAFVLTTSEGHEIWMDHSSRSGYTFYFPNVVPDLVTVTHNHYDHRPWTWTGFIFIDPESEWGQKFLEWKERVPVLMGVTGLNNNIYHQIDKVFNWGLRVYTVETKHYSRAEDSRRGRNAVFVYEVKGLRIVHLGDLGHLLTESQINSIGCPDVLLIPVGGTYTLGASQETRMMEQIQPRPPTPQAVEVMKQLQPRITIPMHYKTEKSAVGELAGVEEFLEQATQFAKVKEFEGHSVNITAGALPEDPEVWYIPYGDYASQPSRRNGALTGRVKLQGRADCFGAMVETKGLQVFDTSTAVDGSFTLKSIPAGVFHRVTVTAPGYLKAEKSCVILGLGETKTLPPITLLGGDINSDGVINGLDLTEVAAAFNSISPANPVADLNADDIVDIFDLVLVGKNFDKSESS